jgi:hypothetical protein
MVRGSIYPSLLPATVPILDPAKEKASLKSVNLVLKLASLSLSLSLVLSLSFPWLKIQIAIITSFLL